METPAVPTSLLVHDGELADVCALMGQLGLEFTERRGSPKPEDEARGWDLVVSTPRRLLELEVMASFPDNCKMDVGSGGFGGAAGSCQQSSQPGVMCLSIGS